MKSSRTGFNSPSLLLMRDASNIKMKLMMKDQMKQKPMRMMKAMRKHMTTTMRRIFSIVTKNAQFVGP
jgi:hypothetical protein